jgi:hypothetical protein
MQTATNAAYKQPKNSALVLNIPATELRSLPIPGFENAKVYTCFVRVTDLPNTLDNYMAVNPRVPSRNKHGILSGPVPKAILQTLMEHPHSMVLKNQGIYLLVNSLKWNSGAIKLELTNPGLHGIVNGGHTYAAIHQARDLATEAGELSNLDDAFIRLTIYTGIDADQVPEIAEGLNRSKQVDDPSLANLQGEFDIIRHVMHKRPGAEFIAYNQGDNKPIYISEVLACLELFNPERWAVSQPNSLYNRQSLALKYFVEDVGNAKFQGLVDLLPEILKLADTIRAEVPSAALKSKFRFGRLKLGHERAGSPKKSKIYLPFLGKNTEYRVPNGWAYPILAAFRANLRDVPKQGYRWIVPLENLVPEVIDSLVAVCVNEHRDNGLRPEQIGKRESAYAQCYMKLQLHLAKQGLL